MSITSGSYYYSQACLLVEEHDIAVTQSRKSGKKDFCKEGIKFAIEVFLNERRKLCLGTWIEVQFIYRDAWTRLNVRPAKTSM